MSSCYFFDRLPVELLHTLFTYFAAHEILLTFTNVSDYVNNVLQAYSAYRLVFKSIDKAHFDHVCRLIEPERVISLTLCDDEETPGQSQLFFSHFHIKQFTQLRSLTLIKMEPETLQFIFPHLSKLNFLCSLSFDYITVEYALANEFSQINYLLSNNYVRVASRLYRLHLHSTRILISTPHPHLYYLKLNICSSDELERIFQHASQLQSLDVHSDTHRWDFNISLPPNRLTRLQLEIDNLSPLFVPSHGVSMEEMEHFLVQLPHLKHLELKTIHWLDPDNGYRWEAVTKNLWTFNFIFLIEHTLIEDILQPFRSPFWQKEKRWFVAYQNNRLFSVPRFLLDGRDISPQFDIHTTAPDQSFIYNQIKTIIVPTASIESNHYFPDVENLVLKDFILPEMITSILDLSRIKHLTVSSLDLLIKFVPLELTLPQLCQLSIDQSVTIKVMEQMRIHRFQQIRKLQISLTNQYTDYMMETLFRLFPSVQDFLYTSPIQSEQAMFRCIDGFKCLAHASFFTAPSLRNALPDSYHSTNSIIKYYRMLRKTNFTCRVDRSPNTIVPHKIHWWIGEQMPTIVTPRHREAKPRRARKILLHPSTTPVVSQSSVESFHNRTNASNNTKMNRHYQSSGQTFGTWSDGMNSNGLHTRKSNENNKKKQTYSGRLSVCLILSLIVLILIGAGIAAISIAFAIRFTTTIATTTKTFMTKTTTTLTTVTTTTQTTTTTTPICFTTSSVQPPNSWSFVGNMTSPRQSHTATFLSQDNSVFIAGGDSTIVVPTTEKYLLATGCFYSTGNMSRARMYHTADQLSALSGFVLLAGGSNTGSLQYADLFDPWSGNTTSITMTSSRQLHTSVLLNTSRVVLIGGVATNTLNTIDIFDTSTLYFSTNLSNTMTSPRHYHSTTGLGSTSDIFLVAGGVNIWTILSSAELYSGSSNTFITLGTAMSTARFSHQATYVPSVDQVLITGGSSDWTSNALNTISIFDIITMSFIATMNTMSSQRKYHTATLLSNGKVLLVGGTNGTASLSSCELIDIVNPSYSSTLVASLLTGRFYHTATLISSSSGDTVLVCGGYNSDLGVLNSCELYSV